MRKVMAIKQRFLTLEAADFTVLTQLDYEKLTPAFSNELVKVMAGAISAYNKRKKDDLVSSGDEFQTFKDEFAKLFE